MTNFMTEHGCLDIWPNTILGVSVKMFLDEIIWFIRLNKANCPPYCECSSPNQLKIWQEQKGWIRMNSYCLTPWAGTQFFPCLRTQTKTSVLFGSRVCWLSDWGCHHGLLESAACRLKILVILSLYNHGSSLLLTNLFYFIYLFFHFYYLSIYLISYWFCLSEQPDYTDLEETVRESWRGLRETGKPPQRVVKSSVSEIWEIVIGGWKKN